MMKNKVKLIPGMLSFMLVLLTVYGCGGPTTATLAAGTPPSGTTANTAGGTSAPGGSPAAAASPSSAGATCNLPLPSDKGWPVQKCDSFDDNTGNWTVESQDNPYARYNIDVKDGAYTLDYTAKGFSGYKHSALTWFDVASAKDFALSVTGKITSNFQNCSWGVAFRTSDSENSFFLFSIYNDNTYAFDIYEDGNWVPLISQRAYDKLKSGDANKLTIVANGGDFTFYINDNQVNSFSGAKLEDTGIKLVASARKASAPAIPSMIWCCKSLPRPIDFSTFQYQP
jgi:hypothetical protein